MKIFCAMLVKHEEVRHTESAVGGDAKPLLFL